MPVIRAEYGVIPLRQVQDAIVNLGGFRGRYDVVVGRAGMTQTDVLQDRVGDHHGVLEDHGDPLQQLRGGNLAHVYAPTVTAPPATSQKRGMSRVTVVLPEPDAPTSAVTVPGVRVRFTSARTGASEV